MIAHGEVGRRRKSEAASGFPAGSTGKIKGGGCPSETRQVRRGKQVFMEDGALNLSGQILISKWTHPVNSLTRGTETQMRGLGQR